LCGFKLTLSVLMTWHNGITFPSPVLTTLLKWKSAINRSPPLFSVSCVV